MNLVFSGPSGSGKGTITELLLKNPKFRKFTTCTTRKPREGEIDGFDYFFMEKEVFEDYVKKAKCLMLSVMMDTIMVVLKKI